MATTLINLTDVKTNNTLAVQGIKLFLNKHKDSKIAIIGDSNLLLTIKDHKNVEIIEPETFKDNELNKYLDIKDIGLRIAFCLLNKKEYIGLVSYSKKTDIADYANKYLKKQETSPLYVATYANYKTHRITCIGDLGYKNNPTIEDYKNYLSLMSRYMKKAFKKEKIEFKLLTFSKDLKNSLVADFKNYDGYKGEIEASEILKADTDIILGHPKEFLGVISGINHGISIYDEYIKQACKKNVGIRYFTYPMMKSVFTSFHMEIDQKLTSGGNILLGFDKNIVLIDPNTIKQGINVSINLASKLESF